MAYRDIVNTPTVDRISGNFGTFVSTLTFAATATAGNLLTLIYRGNGVATQPTGWLIAATATDTASSIVTTLYYRISDGSEAAVDVQQSVSGGWWAEYTEYEGPWAASPLDVFSSQSTAADFDGSLDLGPLTPTQTDTLAIAVASHLNGAAIVNSIDESYTITDQHFGNPGGSGASFIAHKNLGAIAETSPTITWGGTPKAVGVLAVFMQEPVAARAITSSTDPLVAGSTGNVANVTGFLESSTLKSLKLATILLPITLWGGNAQSQSFPPDILQPLVVGGGPSSTPNLFSDSFESGTLASPTASVDAGNFQWGDMAWSYVVDTSTDTLIYRSTGAVNEPTPVNTWESKTGNRNLFLKHSANQEMAEQRFTLDPQEDLWFRYWLKVPDNFSHGAQNNKFFSVFGSTYDAAGTVTFETRPLTGGDSYIYLKDGGAVGGDEQDTPFIDASADAGRWMQVAIHVKNATASGADDGVIQLYRRWEDENDFTLLLDKQNATRQWESGTLGYREGYFMGWANDPYTAQTEWMLDDVEVSTGSLI